MAASAAFLGALAAAGAPLITHVGLVNASGVELAGGSYARKPVTATATGPDVRVSAGDVTFDVPAGGVVAGWRAFSALSAGTNYGGGDLTPETYTGAGQYVLEGAATGFDIDAAAA